MNPRSFLLEKWYGEVVLGIILQILLSHDRGCFTGAKNSLIRKTHSHGSTGFSLSMHSRFAYQSQEVNPVDQQLSLLLILIRLVESEAMAPKLIFPI